MKKIISIFLFVAMILLLTSCNKNFIGTYNFTHVHICDNAGHTADYPIKSWTEDGDAPGIEVKIDRIDYKHVTSPSTTIWDLTARNLKDIYKSKK